MSKATVSGLSQYLSKKAITEIDHWIKKYPKEERQSAVMAALRIAQEELGYLKDEVMDAIAAYLEMPAIAVYEVATFYTMYERAPVGRHVISVCRSISCKLRGSDELVRNLEEHLCLRKGETSEDGRFTLREAECLGACIGAPVMQVDKDYHENLADAEKTRLDSILKDYP